MTHVMFKKLLATALLFSALYFRPSEIAAEPLVDRQMDSLVVSHKIIGFGDGAMAGEDSIKSLIENFYYDQFRNFQDPAAPYFLFMSKDASLAMGVGGCVRMRGYFDWGGAMPGSGFAPYLIPMTKNELHDRQLGSTPAGTSLFFRVLGRNGRWGMYQLYIEANFNGYNSRDFHLKKAYATLNDWTIGYAPSTFGDPSAEAPVIDASGANAKVSNTAVLVRWMRTWNNRFTVAASVEQPSLSAVNSAGFSTRTQYIPDIAAFFQYQWGKSQHIRLAGVMRQLPYHNLEVNKNVNITGWGVQLSAVFHPVDALTVYGAVNGGKGYEGLCGDLLIGKYDLVGDDARPGSAYAPGALSWYAALQYNVKSNLFISTTFSQAKYMPKAGVSPDEYKYGLFSATNIMWFPTPRIQTGLEFDWGRRVNVNGRHMNARRLGAVVSFSF